MKLFECEQIKAIDKYTIKHEPIASIDLMERAAGQLYKWITEWLGDDERFIVFAGTGNNGGDGLALARMLFHAGYSVEVYFIKSSDKVSPDLEINLKRLENETNVAVNIITNKEQLPKIQSGDIVIDSIFGSGLTRPADGLAAEAINLINISDTIRISIDIPSGLFCEDNSRNSYKSVVKAHFTLCFQFPKVAFMFAENYPFVGHWEVLPIGLDQKVIRKTPTTYHLLEEGDIQPLIIERNSFDHKGTFGHGLLISGSYGKMGAAVLSASAALRTGIGLITCHVPSCGTMILQCSLPEAMVTIDSDEKFVSEKIDTDGYSAIGIGPGLGTEPVTMEAVHNLLLTCKKPMVLDADALNILSMNKEWMSLLLPGSVLTPHLKEFERLAGKSANGFERLKKQVEFSKAHKCVIILKGAFSSVTTTDGNIFFNSTGNPGMATAGSGDVLTGIILSLLAQGYLPSDAAKIGVYLHGLAGDIAAEELCIESIIASDIINCIWKAFNKIKDDEPE